MRKLFILVTLFLSHVAVVWSAIIPSHNVIESRSAATCADPSLAETYLMGFTPSGNAHVLQRRFAFINANTNGGDWQIQAETCLAWSSPQEFTVPIYVLYNPSQTDYIYLTPTDGNPPVASGYVQDGVVGYVYDTQACGSVPLYVVYQDVVGDHWYTTIASERDDLVAIGWIDSGIAAYVLPLGS